MCENIQCQTQFTSNHAINEAARIEALTKYYGVILLVSREVFSQMTNPGRHRLLDRVIVKGKSTPVELFERENPCTPKNYAELCARYKAAYQEYYFGHFAAARDATYNAVSCGMPTPATMRVVQIEPGPWPILIALAPQLARNSTPAALVTLPAMMVRCLNSPRTSRTTSPTPAV